MNCWTEERWDEVLGPSRSGDRELELWLGGDVEPVDGNGCGTEQGSYLGRRGDYRTTVRFPVSSAERPPFTEYEAEGHGADAEAIAVYRKTGRWWC